MRDVVDPGAQVPQERVCTAVPWKVVYRAMPNVPLSKDVALVAELAEVAWYQNVIQAHTEIGIRSDFHLRLVWTG